MHREPTADPWTPAEPEPTTLIALWPDDEAPTRDGVAAAIRSFAGGDAAVFGDAAPREDGVLWNAVVAVPGRDRPAIFWSEPARPLDPGELDDPAAQRCRWILGVETLLDGDDALADFTTIMRLLSGAFGRVPAVLDVNSGRWHPRRSLDAHFAGGAGPPEDVLWMTHVAVSAADDDAGVAWLHTHGLPRCGRPDLEMLGVPARHAERAAELLSALAGRMIEEGAPAPGEAFEAGPALPVQLLGWRQVAPQVADAPGGMADRLGLRGAAHVGARAVVCAAGRDGGPLVPWPQEVLERIDRAEGSFYLSRYETRRRAERARAEWSLFVGAFGAASTPPGGADDRAVRFLVKAGIGEEASEASGDGGREHLWFAVRRCEADRFQGELLNRPALAGTLNRGDVTWVERGRVSDWSVVTPRGSYGPQDAAALGGAPDAAATDPGGGT